MKAELPIGSFIQLRLHLSKERHTLRNLAARRLLGQFQVMPEVSRLRFAQPGVERRDPAVLKHGRERLETLAGPRLDERSDDENIHEPRRFVRARVPAQAFRIAGG